MPAQVDVRHSGPDPILRGPSTNSTQIRKRKIRAARSFQAARPWFLVFEQVGTLQPWWLLKLPPRS